jgi:hypothetical protein
MNGLVKTIRHIQIKKISFTPQLYTAIVTYETHPTEYDEYDDIEHQKNLINKLIKDNWFVGVSEKVNRPNPYF